MTRQNFLNAEGGYRLAGPRFEIKHIGDTGQRGGQAYISGMSRAFVSLALGPLLALSAAPVIAQSAAAIEQIPMPNAAGPVGVQAIDRWRSSATVQSPAADKPLPLVSSETLAACQRARAADRPAPAGVDCTKALQVATERSTPSAESSLLPLFGQSATVTPQASSDTGSSVDAGQVSRQLSSGDFQGTTGSDAAASVARDRPPPQAAPPPR